MANTDVKVAARQAGVKLWELADALGIADSTLSRQLRHEFPDEKKQKILEIIDRLSKERS